MCDNQVDVFMHFFFVVSVASCATEYASQKIRSEVHKSPMNERIKREASRAEATAAHANKFYCTSSFNFYLVHKKKNETVV